MPTVAEVEARSGYREIEPVTAVPVSDAAGLRRAFQETMARGNPVVPNLRRADLPEPVVLKYAGVKSSAAFVRTTLTWDIVVKDGIYRIVGLRRRPDRGWEEDPNQIVTFPPGTSADDVITRMIAILTDAA
ncbi:MAG TPA: hypothetical protein VKY65_13795 [Alphaproteobacteria bacterium]|nr:hypothetical protein [Alphaproteobacteria bacterium]